MNSKQQPSKESPQSKKDSSDKVRKVVGLQIKELQNILDQQRKLEERKLNEIQKKKKEEEEVIEEQNESEDSKAAAPGGEKEKQGEMLKESLGKKDE